MAAPRTARARAGWQLDLFGFGAEEAQAARTAERLAAVGGLAVRLHRLFARHGERGLAVVVERRGKGARLYRLATLEQAARFLGAVRLAGLSVRVVLHPERGGHG